jgi:hypothetical protein
VVQWCDLEGGAACPLPHATVTLYLSWYALEPLGCSG